MKPFLQEVAEKIFTLYSRNLDTLTLVFPNRRAALYFRKHLSALLTKPVFAPALLTIEDFITGFSSRRVPDKLELIHRLQTVHNTVVKKFSEKTNAPGAASQETFDKFYFWGDMLLRDFDEVDKYLVQAEHLFKDLSNQKALDSGLDFLTEEQRDFLRSFWLSFDEQDSLNKQKFLHVWRQLPALYNAFRESLDREGLAYEGMLHREVAETIERVYTNRYTEAPEKTGQAPSICFIGFNALTRAEERIITFFVDRGLATLYWDVDAYYMNNNTQEAGKFLREYQQHTVLGKTFTHDIPANFNTPKNIHLYGASQPVGQAKLMAQLLAEKIRAGYNPEETLVVLPDEKLVMPVLHGVSAHVEKLNVTMGFPLSSTPLFNLVELLMELQINRKEDQFNHREVVALLGHPYVVAAGAAEAQAKRKEILNQNWVLVSAGFLRSATALHRIIFQPVFFQQPEAAGSFLFLITHYLKDCIVEIGKLPTVTGFDQEYCFHVIKLLNRIAEVLHPQATDQELTKEGDKTIDQKQARKQEREALKSFLRLFRQLISAEKIPFRGEPLHGLQVMGVLETRNLDFKNVFILSLNEGAFPSFNSKGSYIPFNIRKAYGLPTVEHQDAMYAYLFYRILQRAENVFLFYNAETDDLGQGEMSRYLQQLIYESGVPIERYMLHNALQPHEVVPIQVKKDERVYQALNQYGRESKPGKTLSPSALNDYLECRLRFYFKYVARIREANQVEEDLDARVLGNFLHKVMELFYLGIIQAKGNKTIEQDDFNGYKKRIDNLIDLAFIDNYSLNPTKQVVYEGQRLVVREMVKRFIDRIIEIDKAYAPFSIEALERRDITHTITLEAAGTSAVVLGGSIDRADRKGDQVRVIDYKTGKDQLSFTDVPSLFSRDGKRNKAAFQTFLYTLLYKKSLATPGVKLIPGLINRINLFNDDFTFGLWQGGEVLSDATPLLPEFEAQLKTLLEEIFNPEVPFDQTQQTENCSYCPYRRLCYR